MTTVAGDQATPTDIDDSFVQFVRKINDCYEMVKQSTSASTSASRSLSTVVYELLRQLFHPHMKKSSQCNKGFIAVQNYINACLDTEYTILDLNNDKTILNRLKQNQLRELHINLKKLRNKNAGTPWTSEEDTKLCRGIKRIIQNNSETAKQMKNLLDDHKDTSGEISIGTIPTKKKMKIQGLIKEYDITLNAFKSAAK